MMGSVWRNWRWIYSIRACNYPSALLVILIKSFPYIKRTEKKKNYLGDEESKVTFLVRNIVHETGFLLPKLSQYSQWRNRSTYIYRRVSAQSKLLKYLVEDVLLTDSWSYQIINKKRELTFIKKLRWQSLNVHNLNLQMIWETCILIPNFRARKPWLESYDLHSDLMQN